MNQNQYKDFWIFIYLFQKIFFSHIPKNETHKVFYEINLIIYFCYFFLSHVSCILNRNIICVQRSRALNRTVKSKYFIKQIKEIEKKMFLMISFSVKHNQIFDFDEYY